MDILISFGFTEKLGKPLAPLMSAANLPKNLSLVALLGTVNSRAEHAVISSMLKEGKLCEMAVYSYNLVVMPIEAFSTVLQYLLPVSLGSMGFYGIIFTLLMIFETFIGMCMGLIIGRLSLQKNMRVELNLEMDHLHSKKLDLQKSFKKALVMVKNVGIKYSIISLFFLVFVFLGVFDFLKSAAFLLSHYLCLNLSALSIVPTYVADPLTGIMVAGEILKAGITTSKDILISLVIGKFLFTLFIECPRSILPFYVSIYPLKLATKLVILLIIHEIISILMLIFFVSLCL